MTETPSLYDLLGGETGVRTLVDRFYDFMDSAPEAQDVRALHAASLKGSREKLFMFLTGWSGGPPLYIQKFGHPKLRMRHLPFVIAERERDQWLWCMTRAIDAGDFHPAVVEHLKTRFSEMADFLRNQ
ncbi:MAG: group II truncated hemoglobin [Anaerolineales bacterium]|nr:group II truncated hemoglobin [Anaerolineales bacterium]